ncbi:MAG: trypsin-like serine protease, partial [Caldilineaceae bacterium]|nr:trypsin-like serine protease [Caldilineaceae bacterium]
MKTTKLLSIVGVLILLSIAMLFRGDSLAQETPPTPTSPNAAATRPLPGETPLPTPAPRIVGGAPATHGEWPWQALVNANDGQYTYLCGGSLIAPQWVVTAGHCVSSGSTVYAPSQMRVVLGEYLRNTNDQTEQFPQVSQVIRHPNYNSSSLDYDIALLRLSSPATLNAYVDTIPLLR